MVAPLNQLVTASQRIEHGQFDSPPLDTNLPNELGLLAKTFNQMSSELHKLYRSLEASVEEKTRDLHEAKRRLEVLYQCSQALNTSQIDVHCFRHILQIVRDNEAAEYLELNVGENWRISEGQPNPELPMQILPVTMQETVYGELHWQNSHVSSSEPLLNSVSSMLGRGLYFNQAQKHFQQLLLMEERATIARELHDSLAQVLSYLRIQLTLLKRSIPEDNATAQSIMADFSQALNDAYRQLRELLTTFRLTLQQADLLRIEGNAGYVTKSNQRQTDPRLPSANPGTGCANAGAFVANYSRSSAECDEARQRQRNRRQLRHRAGRQSHGLYP